MGSIALYIYHGKKGWDVSELVVDITWYGRKSSLARSLDITLLDDDSPSQSRIKIDVEKGLHLCVQVERKRKIQRNNHEANSECK